MNLRSHSSKGKAVIEYEDSLEEEEEEEEEVESQGAADSDPDYLDDLGEDSSDSLDGDGIVSPNLSVDPTAELMLMDENVDEMVARRRKRLPARGGRRRGVEEGVQNHAETFDPNVDEGEKQDVSENKKSIEGKRRKRKKQDRPALMWEIWEKENNRWLDEHEANNVGLDDQNEIRVESVETPNTLVVPLLKYQKEWLAWALKQEESARGGILADEMGMGKTVQAIALVLAKKGIRREFDIPIPSVTSTSTTFPAVKGTLVICPLVAVRQWVNEINRFTLKGSNAVVVYHGSNRKKGIGELSEYDFVITTYSTVEADYRKIIMPLKYKCESCGNLLYKRNLFYHKNYTCRPNPGITLKQLKQQRKAPKLEIKMSKKDFLSDKDASSDSNDEVPKRGDGKRAKTNSGYKLPLGDFLTDNSAGTEESESKMKSILHSVNWDRIILDEAHYIKNRCSNTAKAIFALKSSFKWALTGTPVQNRVGEIYSLVRFLEIEPYSYYFCKDCDCRILDYNTTSEACRHCPHKLMRHFCWWTKFVASPIKDHGNTVDGKRAMVLLKNKILKATVLRRTKKGRASDLALPPRIVTLRRDSMDIKEEDYYTSVYSESRAQFNTYIAAQTLMNNYAHIFDLLTRLRQAVDHPYLVIYSGTAGRIKDVSNSEQECDLCHETVEEAVVTSCCHVFCKSCLIDFSSSMGQASCPTCSKPLTVDFIGRMDNEYNKPKTTVEGFKRSSILNRIKLDDFQTSTKIDALREEIRFMVERDGSAKGIVFSQFTSFLDLIQYSLQKSGVCCVQLVGSMSMAARDGAIKKFTDDPECRIFLMSLKAGGVALNLTVASHVFMMDPWWNPAVERQAQDRIHRIGQYKPIRVVKFVIKDTIEERILELQEKKELMFEGTVGGGSTDVLAKLTEADLRFLFHS